MAEVLTKEAASVWRRTATLDIESGDPLRSLNGERTIALLDALAAAEARAKEAEAFRAAQKAEILWITKTKLDERARAEKAERDLAAARKRIELLADRERLYRDLCEPHFLGGYRDGRDIEIFRHGMQSACNAIAAVAARPSRRGRAARCRRAAGPCPRELPGLCAERFMRKREPPLAPRTGRTDELLRVRRGAAGGAVMLTRRKSPVYPAVWTGALRQIDVFSKQAPDVLRYQLTESSVVSAPRGYHGGYCRAAASLLWHGPSGWALGVYVGAHIAYGRLRGDSDETVQRRMGILEKEG